MGQFISVGMRVLPHSDLSRLSQSDLWQITKGIEEFNAIGENRFLSIFNLIGMRCVLFGQSVSRSVSPYFSPFTCFEISN